MWLDGDVVVSGDEPLKMYSVYAPPEHEPGFIQINKPNK